MTRDEHRAKCIEAIGRAYQAHERRGEDEFVAFEDEPTDYIQWVMELATEQFDSLPSAGARVNPIEATEGMIEAGKLFLPGLGIYVEGDDLKSIWSTMSAAGDLTNPPGDKP